MINTLEDALARIKELEEENQKLLSELEYYRNRNYGGRKKHNDAWMAAYNDFVVKYEGGMAIMEIVAEGEISRRTAYRYKAYYDERKKLQEGK
jgi:hypoxanthine phosphoribosyltransferase